MIVLVYFMGGRELVPGRELHGPSPLGHLGSGVIFTKGLSQVLGLSWPYLYAKVKPKTRQ